MDLMQDIWIGGISAIKPIKNIIVNLFSNENVITADRTGYNI